MVIKYMFRNKRRKMAAVNGICCNFGLKFNKDVTLADLRKSGKRKLSCAQLEKELNELAHYVFDGKRTVGFHEFRQFPYIFHGDVNSPELLSSDQLAGLAKAYTSADVYFVRFIKLFLICFDGPLYAFPNIDYIKRNSVHVAFREVPLSDMAIDEVIK